MALVIANRVREASATIGTGAMSLLGAALGYQSFAAAVGTGNTTYYAIVSGAGQWEIGLGTVVGTELQRTTVLDSSSGGSLVNFTSGTKDVFATLPAGIPALVEDLAATGTGKGAEMVATDVHTYSTVAQALGAIDWAQQQAPTGVNLLRYVPVAQWAAILDGTSTYDVTADIAAAAAAAVAQGKQLDMPAGQYIVNELDLPPGIALIGYGSQNSTSATRPTTRLKCTTGAFCLRTEREPAVRGYRIENITVIGHAGADYGINARGTSGFLKNITVLDVTNGVGIAYSRAWRGSVEDIQVYRCGLGMLLGFTDSAVNGTNFRAVTIELCRVGLYSFDLTTAPQIGNNFDNLLIEACGSAYHTGNWPSFLTLSADFKADTGMTEATVQGALILERNFYAQFSALYLEVNTGIYIWQGSTGMMLVESGIVEMTEPANTYTGRPMILRRSPFAMRHVRLTWDDSKTTEIFGIASAHRQETEHLIFNTAGNTRPLYYDYTLSTANVRPGNSRLHMRDGTMIEPRSRNASLEVVTPSLASANIRLNCTQGSVFVLNGITQNTAIDVDFPTNGQEITVIVNQDATGGRTVSFSSAFVHGWSDTGNTASKTSAISFVYSSTLAKFVQSAAQTPYV